ncbi:putative uncharacterized protein DDB_G0282499 [Phlebotomus papatasi]|uniref:putative uncharacterized protein DDB_G0282499 n=1 Tax=Phlebotomus papatasi TaxID=29031 RepID=UPI0024842E36|nr:putative uncharacterized protein DDB_G0282499 [Phlebotomus papatasi]
MVNISRSQEEREYSQEQADLVRKIKGCKNHYEELNIKRTASDAEIHKAFRKLSLLIHPDKNYAPGAEEAFKAILKAKVLLLDPVKRQNYDNELKRKTNESYNQSSTSSKKEKTNNNQEKADYNFNQSSGFQKSQPKTYMNNNQEKSDYNFYQSSGFQKSQPKTNMNNNQQKADYNFNQSSGFQKSQPKTYMNSNQEKSDYNFYQSSEFQKSQPKTNMNNNQQNAYYNFNRSSGYSGYQDTNQTKLRTNQQNFVYFTYNFFRGFNVINSISQYKGILIFGLIYSRYKIVRTITNWLVITTARLIRWTVIKAFTSRFGQVVMISSLILCSK